MASRIANWGARQGYALLSTARALTRHALASALTVLVLGFALTLPLTLNVLVHNLRAVSGDLSETLGLTVYLKPQASEQKARELAESARARADVARVTVITATEALQEFRQQSGFGAALDALTDNPLPNALEVRATAAAAASPARLEALRASLAALPDVDSVQLDRDWALRLAAIMGLARQLLLVTAALLAAGVIAVVGNTIRLEIQSRRTEIEVTKLVGGSNAFVRRPFLYAGALYGVAAGLVAWGVVALALAVLAPQVGRLAASYGSQFMLQGPSRTEVGVLLAAGVILGWLGAALAAAGQLSRIQPRAS